MTSAQGQTEVTIDTSPICNLVGQANEGVVILGGEKCLALVDSGSMITSVGEDFYTKHLEDRFPLQELNNIVKVEGAGGHLLEYRGYIEVDVQVPDHADTPLWVPVLIAPSTTYNQRVPMIVGTNIIRMLQSPGSDVWSSAMSAVSAQESVEEEDAAVYCLKQMVIPPNGTINFKGRVGAHGRMTSGVLEPAETLPGGIMLVKAAVSLDECNKVNVVLKNVTNRSIEIPPRQRVASLQSATILEPSGLPQPDNVQQDIKEIPVSLEECNLTDEEMEMVKCTLLKWKDVFAHSSTELGLAKDVKHSINLTDPVPFKDKPRRIPPAMYDEVKRHLQDMLACKAIRPSSSPYCSNVVLVRKKDNSLRLCLDFRRLNSKTVRDAYFMPRIDETLDSLHGATRFSSLDLQSGYWQVELEEEDKVKTAFCVGSNLGFYECERMPFGLTNAPATFQRLMEKALRDLPNCFAYLDDIIIYSAGTVEDHLTKLERVFERLQEFGLKLKPSKCHLLRERLKYLGHIVSSQGVEADEDKTEIIRNWTPPTTVHELRQALGFFGYYRRFVKDFAKLAKPLHDLLKGVENRSRKNKTTPVVMTSEALEAFEDLKSKLTHPPILAYADYSQPFQVHTDASLQGLGAILYQQQEGKARVIAYASRGLKPSEVNYPAHKLEFLALKWSVCDKFHDYLYGHHFEVYTDNNPMSYVLSSAKLDATGHRWLAELSLHDFNIHYKPGNSNTDADFLSRMHATPSLDAGSVVDREAIKAICSAVRCQDRGCVEVMCVSHNVVDEYEQNVFPMDIEMERTASVWRDLQLQDPVLDQLIPLVEDGDKPEMSSTTRELKPYVREWDKLILREGVLYRSRVDPESESTVYQLVLPESEREQAFRGLHDEVGHLGRDRTLQLIRARFFWPKMAEEVKLKISSCPACIRRKSQGPQRAPLVNIVTTQPMELLCIDYLSLEPSKGGIENILVLTDHFTRLAHAIPTRNQTARTTAQVLYNFFLTYGFPLKLHSDQGRSFESRIIKELCKLTGIVKSRTTPYHPMGNGMTERFNRTLLNMLGCLTNDQKADWKKYVSSVVHAYNSTKHESTGFSPFFLMFGRHPRLPIDVAMGVELQEDLEIDFTKNLKDRLDFAYKLATDKAQKSASRYKSHYDKRVRGSTISVGDRVLVRNVSIRGKHKLANIWEDPVYVVLEQPNLEIPVFVVLREDKKGVKRTLHRNLLLPVNFLPLPARTNGADKGPAQPKPTPRTSLAPVPKASSVSSDQSGSESDSGSDDERYVFRSRLNPRAREFVPSGKAQDDDNGVPDQPIIPDEAGADESEVSEEPVHEEEEVEESEEEQDHVEEEENLEDSREESDDELEERAAVSPVLPLPVPKVRPRRNVKNIERYGDIVSFMTHFPTMDKFDKMILLELIQKL